MKTLEEVKEYFKDAKEVECLFNKQLVDITKNIIEEINEDRNAFWISISDHLGIGVKLYDKVNFLFAEIISYKDGSINYKLTDTISQPNELKSILTEIEALEESQYFGLTNDQFIRLRDLNWQLRKLIKQL
jgi:hypothetical protein